MSAVFNTGRRNYLKLKINCKEFTLTCRFSMVIESAELHYMIRGYHVYKKIWIPELSHHEMLTTKKEDGKILNIIICMRRLFEGGGYSVSGLRSVRNLNTVFIFNMCISSMQIEW